MGKNLDLVDMLGLPKTIVCPYCKAIKESYYDDHDVQCCTDYNKGHWKIHRDCEECGKDFYHEFKIEIKDLTGPVA